MFALAATPSAAVPTAASRSGRASRIVRAIRGRLAPTPEDLEERAGWRVKTRWLLAGWAALSVVSAFGTVLTPALLAVPLILVAFTPRLPFLFLAAASTHPVVFFCVAVPRMLVADPIHIALGRRYGARFVPRRAQRLMSRLGLAGVALRPTSKVLAAAGACRLRTSRILLADIVGTVVLVGGVYVGTTTVLS